MIIVLIKKSLFNNLDIAIMISLLHRSILHAFEKLCAWPLSCLRNVYTQSSRWDRHPY